MALKGLDIFKLTPKTNCKDCGSPTCMAFAMKVAQGAVPLEKCPHLSDEAKAQLSEATAPPMKSIEIGAGGNRHTLGGETVLFRHEKTLVSRSLFAVTLCTCMDEETLEAAIAGIPKIDYERIGERMYIETVHVKCAEGASAEQYLALVKRAQALRRTLVLEVRDPETAKAALALVKDEKPVLLGANPDNWEAMNAVAAEAGVVLGVSAPSLETLYATVEKLEAAGNKNLILNATGESVKDSFARAVQIRRAALRNNDRSFGYPSFVDVGALARGDAATQAALAAMFILKYGSIIAMETMRYAEALPLYGLRQNIFTDPQKPMKVDPGVYPLNGADPNAVCLTTVDFALTYFVVSGEIERSGVPVNLLISDAGGYSVLTAWAAGKLSASSLAKFF
ncbi:MAG: acetyl-CoA decarbonylase/synthase complex subunit gamma, partial [Clostridia bacterium]|nr:acetyl-CoA decarbonylase/synthase complex subunit gamma [Clostridia bacterium]